MNLRAHMKFYGLVLVAALMLACQPALAEKRVALVIGNSNYKNAALLPNPANDAAAIAATLKGAGFDVVEVGQRDAAMLAERHFPVAVEGTPGIDADRER